jgi:hypothetical protein
MLVPISTLLHYRYYPNGTGNATHNCYVNFKRYVTGTSAAKPGLSHLQTYFTGIANDNTGTVLFCITMTMFGFCIPLYTTGYVET